MAAKVREEGNELFRVGDYAGAAAKYTQCVQLQPDPKSEDHIAALKNRAACYLKLVRRAAFCVPSVRRRSLTGMACAQSEHAKAVEDCAAGTPHRRPRALAQC